MAPEVMQSLDEEEYDERVDIYSFGMTLYEMLVGPSQLRNLSGIRFSYAATIH